MINRYMYSLLLGMLILRIQPPKLLLWYMEKYPPMVEDKYDWILLSTMRGSGNFLDPYLQMLIRSAINPHKKGN